MRFMRGEPMISVGIAEGLHAVTLSADGPTRIMFDEVGLPKTLYAPPEAHFSFRPLTGKPAEIRYWAIVETNPYAEGEAAVSAAQRWRAEGYPARIFEVGTIVALQGNVLDTRERHVGIGDFPRREGAERLIAELSAKRGLRPFLYEELVKPPSAVIGVFDEAGKLVHRASDSVYFGTVEGGLVSITGRREPRKYWGHIYVVVDRQGQLAVVNSVSAEKLLWGLVPAELFPTAPLEALKAQAVTARGEIFSKLAQRHFGEPYHLCSEQHCQVYAGAGYERPETNRAVDQTRGLLAVRPRHHEGENLRLVDSVYSSSCGGFSGANEDVWGNLPSESLRARLDGAAADPALAPFKDGLGDEARLRHWVESYPPTECARSSFARSEKFRWKRSFADPELEGIIQPLGIGKLRDLKVLGREPGGRITGLRLMGSGRALDVLRELPVRRLFGNLNSGMFVLDLERNGQGDVTRVTFTGGGWGHGVGMCQMGAIGRAERGQDFKQILEHYYSGAVVERLY